MSTGHMVREGEIKNSYFHRSKGRATIFLNFVPRRLRTFNFPSRLPFSWRISLMHFYDLFVEKIPSRWLFVCGIFLCLVREEGEYSCQYRRKSEFKQILQHWRKSKSEPNLFRLSKNVVKVRTDLSTSQVIVRIWTNLLLLIKERHRNPNKCCNIEKKSSIVLHLWKYSVRIQTNLPTSKKLIGIYTNRYPTSDANNCTAYVHAFIGNVKAYRMYIIFKNT